MHSKFSPSNSAKWLNCSGSILMEEMFPDISPDEQYTNEGSTAHYLAELCLTNVNLKIDDFLNEVKFGVTIDEEIIRNVKKYIEYVNSLRASKSEAYFEQRIDFTNFAPDGFGTVDAIVINKNQCHIIDLKYGQGIKVDAFGNTQLKLYALGVFQARPNIEEFVLHVFQPRMNSVSTHTVSKDEISNFGVEVKHCVKKCLGSNIEFNPSPKTCQWCTAKSKCKAIYDQTVGNIKKKIDSNVLSDRDLTEVLENKDLYKKYVGSVEKRVYDQIEHGNGFQGWKLVEGRSVRKWNKEAEEVLIQELGERAYSKKLIGLTDAKKLLGAEMVDELTFKPKGKLTLARDYDSRDEVDNDLDVESMIKEVL